MYRNEININVKIETLVYQSNCIDFFRCLGKFWPDEDPLGSKRVAVKLLQTKAC